jgi:hypothetical protein
MQALMVAAGLDGKASNGLGITMSQCSGSLDVTQALHP